MRRRLPLITFLLAAFAVSGIATAGAGVISPFGFPGSDPIDFGSHPVGSVSTATSVTITNNGSADLMIDGNGVQVGGTNPGAFPLSNDLCSGQVVTAGNSCSVDVKFAPSNGVITYNATLDVTDTADGATGSVGLTGNGTGAPTADLSANNLSFGDQRVGTTSDPPQSITLTNNGNVALHITSMSKGGTDPDRFTLANNTCNGATVLAGGQCSVDVTFTPSVTGGASASLAFTDDAPSGTQTVGLSGNGTVSSVSVSPVSPFDFGNRKVGTGGSQVFTVTNNGGANLSIAAGGVTVSGAGFSKTSDNCSGAVVVPNDNCTFSVGFSPGSAGPLSGLASVNSNDPSSPFGVSLSGNGTVPVATPSPPTSFATTIGNPQTKTITLTNTGQADLVVQSATLIGDATFTKTITGSPCGGATLAPGGHCTVDINFLPTTTAAQNATLTFKDDDNSTPNSVQGVSLTGTVLIPGIRSDPASLSFESLAVGAISPASSVTITNTGGADLRISSLAIGGANYKSFRFGVQTCTSAPIAAGSSCTVNVRFTPTNLGARVATVLVRSDAGASTSTLSVAVTGVGVRPPPVIGLRGAAGCIDTRLSWANPDAAGLIRVQVVRNSAHAPRGPFDGVIMKHTSGALADNSVSRLRTYYYAVYAVYLSFDHSRQVYSTGAAARLHTGRVCKPRNGAVIADLSPAVDWTAYPGARSYAYILQRQGHTILVRYPKQSATTLPRSWTFNGQSKSIQSGGVYSFYLYTYTAARPRGFLIGLTVFTER
jgi:hypothetical protein